MQICSNFDLFDLPTYLGSVVCINKRANKEQRNKYSINHFAQSSLSLSTLLKSSNVQLSKTNIGFLCVACLLSLILYCIFLFKINNYKIQTKPSIPITLITVKNKNLIRKIIILDNVKKSIPNQDLCHFTL